MMNFGSRRNRSAEDLFLRQYGDTMKAIRARVMLDQLKAPPSPISETVDLNAEPAGDPVKLFNGTDISITPVR